MARTQKYTTTLALSADSTTAATVRASKIQLPSGPLKRARVRQRISNPQGTFQQKAQAQFWNDPDSSETPSETDLSSLGAPTGPQAVTNWTDLTTPAAGAQKVLLVHEVKLSSGSALATATVQTDWELEFYDIHRQVEIPWRHFVANTTSQVYYPMTGWFEAESAESARTVLELAGLAGNFEVQMGCEITNDRTTPGTPVALGSSVFTTDGKKFPTQFESPSVNGKLYIRFGYFVRVTSAGSGMGAVTSMIELVKDA